MFSNATYLFLLYRTAHALVGLSRASRMRGKGAGFNGSVRSSCSSKGRVGVITRHWCLSIVTRVRQGTVWRRDGVGRNSAQDPIESAKAQHRLKCRAKAPEARQQ